VVRSAGRNAPVGVGIVGLSATGGWAARAHVPALSALDGIELRGLTASSAAAGHAAAEAHGVPAYASVEDLARAADVDLVVVAVKVPEHRRLVLPALAAGVPVLCEWPLALDLREARELEAAAGETPTFVGLQARSSPTFRWLADLVVGGYVGEVLSATVVASSSGWGDPVSGRLRYTLDRTLGATLLAIAFGHVIDAVSMVVGELQDVTATTATRRPRVPLAGTGDLVPMTAEDQIAVSGTLPGGAVLSVHHRAGLAAGPGFTMLVDGTEGTLEITAPFEPHIAPVAVRGARGRGRPVALRLPDGYDDHREAAGTAVHSLMHAYAAVRDDLLHGTARAPGFAHAVRRHRLLDAVERSAATGRRVSVPDGSVVDPPAGAPQLGPGR
jgi:predicted dehydrogenase